MQRTCWLVSLAANLLFASAACGEETIEYNRDVRAILADNCFACHGPDSAARKADLRLDQREMAIEMGAIMPGKPDESEIIARITSEDTDLRMPPPTTHKTVTPEQVEVLKGWIAAGAEYQSHWSFIAPVRPAVPAVKDATWPRNPIDNFILARLEAEGLSPAPEADRRTLARRASLDLTGLPPEPAVVEAFVNDTSPDAYDHYVDYLLSLPAWGEHRGRYWLDVARYADTHGIHFDNFREMWSYRDWVIDAFNRNIPFSQFTIEQLAGDLLPDRTLDQVVASGFNRCNMTTNEGGVIAEEYLVLYARDRTETTSQVWLGMTTGCAVCHDHKFDPFSQREFYELAAFFNNTTQGAMDGNIKDTPPVVMVPPDDLRNEWDALKVQVADAAQQVDARRASGRADFDGWLAASPTSAVENRITSAGLCFYAPLNDNAGNVLTFSVDGEAAQRHDRRPAAMGRRRHGAQGAQDAGRNAGRSQRRRQFREGPGVHLQRPGQSAQERSDRRHFVADGRHQRLSRLGCLAEQRQARHARDPPMAGRRGEGYWQKGTRTQPLVHDHGQLRSRWQRRQREDLSGWPTAGCRRGRQYAEEFDSHRSAAEVGAAQQWLAPQRHRFAGSAHLRPRSAAQ